MPEELTSRSAFNVAANKFNNMSIGVGLGVLAGGFGGLLLSVPALPLGVFFGVVMAGYNLLSPVSEQSEFPESFEIDEFDDIGLTANSNLQEGDMSSDWEFLLDGDGEIKDAAYRFEQDEYLCFSQEEMSGMLAGYGIEHEITNLKRDDGANLGLSIIVNGSENIEKLENMFQDSSYHAEFLERRESVDYSSFFEKAGVLGEPTYKTNLNKAMGMPVIGKPS